MAGEAGEAAVEMVGEVAVEMVGEVAREGRGSWRQEERGEAEGGRKRIFLPFGFCAS